MANVTVRNTTESQIHITGINPTNGDVVDVAVPGGTMDADSNKLVPGSAEVDQSFLEAQIKRAASVKAHFAEGRLQVIKPQPKSEKPPQE